MAIYGAPSDRSAEVRNADTGGVVEPVGNGFYETKVKPTIDRVGGVVLALLTLPILAGAALLVLVTMGRPVFYSSSRIGLNGERFNLYKLRTMIPDRRHDTQTYDGPERRERHKSEDDPRVLPVGKFLRKTRLDELPQFWNVIKGDMSLVGPRPEMPMIVAGYEDWQHDRHNVKPGVTGPWQISDQNGTPMHECTEMDIQYIKRVSLKNDLAIMVKTPVAMVRRRGF